MAGSRGPLAIALTVVAALVGIRGAVADDGAGDGSLTAAEIASATDPARLARALDAAHVPVQQKAVIDRLYSLGMSAGPAAPSLVRRLRAPDTQVRLAALAALYNMGVAAGAASVGPLIATLNDPDPQIRAAAARALGSLGSWIWEDDPAHEEAFRAAKVAQRPLAALVADPRQPLDVRLPAAASLAEMPIDPSLAPTLAAALASPDDDVRVQICHALTRARARAAVPALEARLRDSNTKVQVAAAEALLAAGADKNAVARLARLLVEHTTAMSDRAQAAYVLQDHPTEARAAAREIVVVAFMSHEHLIESMPSDGREEARQWADRAITRIGAPTVPFIVPFLRSRGEENEQRRDAIAALCGLGPAARAAVPALMPLLASPDAETRGEVASCLAANIRVEPKDIAPKVLPLLSDRESWVVREVVRATKALGPAAAPALPRLRALARDKDGQVRTDAIDAIGAIGKAAGSARPELEAGLTDREERVQVAAALALVKTRIAPDVGLRRLLAPLTEKAAPPSGGPSYPTATATWRLGELASQPEKQQVLAALIAALGSGNRGMYDGVAHSIAAFGGDAAATAIGPLTAALARDGYGPSQEACAALAAFGPKILPAVPALVQAIAGEPGWASRALLVTARRTPEVAAGVKAQCGRTTGRQLRNCRSLIRQIDAREEPDLLP